MENNIDHYPRLLKLSTTASEVVDQQQYLLDNGLEETKDTDEYMTSLAISSLKEAPHYIVVLFEEVGLPVIDKITDNPKVFYLQ